MFHSKCITVFQLVRNYFPSSHWMMSLGIFSSMFTSPKRPAPLPALRVSTIRGRKRIGAELPSQWRNVSIAKKVSHMHHSDDYQPTINTLNPFQNIQSIHIFVSFLKILKLTHLDKGARLSFGTSFKVLTGLASAATKSTKWYCWWFRNPIPNHRLDGDKNPVKSGINYLSLNWLARFLRSTVVWHMLVMHHTTLSVLFPLGTTWE